MNRLDEKQLRRLLHAIIDAYDDCDDLRMAAAIENASALTDRSNTRRYYINRKQKLAQGAA